MLRVGKRARKVGEILNEVAIRNGEAVLAELFQEKLGSTPPETRPLSSVALTTAQDWEMLIGTALQARGSVLKRTFTLGSRATAFWTSSLLGFLLPNREARFFRKGEPDNFLALKSAPLVSIEIVIEWMKRLFALALRHPELGEAEKHDLEWMVRLLADVEGGLTSGARWKRGSGTKPIRVPLAPLAYHRLEQWFSTWKNKNRNG